MRNKRKRYVGVMIISRYNSIGSFNGTITGKVSKKNLKIINKYFKGRFFIPEGIEFICDDGFISYIELSDIKKIKILDGE